ncbi:MAG TPA: tetratricopeptide repeat protein [Longimicrobium sp.]|nr:tetratricopeptide repeat protein [Longimicrobium sp.]
MASSSSTVSRTRPASTLHPDDAMALRAAALSAWARRNARIIIGLSVLAVLVVGGLVVWNYLKGQREAQAAQELLALRQNPAVATAAGSREVETFIQQYDGTMEADEARLMLAELRMNAGNPRGAISELTKLASGGSTLAPQAGMMLGSAHAQGGDRAAAIRAYEQAAEKSRLRYQRFEALGQAALQHEVGGNHAAAAEIYRRLLGEAEPNSQQATVVEMRMTEALARATAR